MRRTNFLRTLGVAAAMILLSGCALPPIFTIASLAADFASYGETGKTISDHGLSLVLQKDCAMLRVLEGAEQVCVEEDEATALASNGADRPGRVREYRLADLADEQEEAYRVMSVYPVDEEARRQMEANVFLGSRMSAGVFAPLPATDSLLQDIAYLDAGALPGNPILAELQLSSAGRLDDTISINGAVRVPGEWSN